MESITFLEALYISVLAMLIVFILLAIISGVLSSFKFIFKENETVVEKVITPAVPAAAIVQGVTYTELESDEDLKLAAMIATIDMAGDRDISNYRVVSAKKI